MGECAFIRPGLGLVSAISEAEMIQEGKHPGKTNLTDVDNALNILKFLLEKPAAVIVKHNNPCGAAYGAALSEAYFRANRADRIAAFGGAAVFNRPLDKSTAELIARDYLEVVAAPDYEEGVVSILAGRGNLRILRVPRMDLLEKLKQTRFVDFKSLQDGGLIVQQSPVNAIQRKEDFKSAACTHQGKEFRMERPPTAKGTGRHVFRLVGRTGGDLQFGPLRQGRMHGRHRHRRTGPGRGGRDSGLQGLHQVCRLDLF